MASTPFTLAALATSAVPGLSVTGTRPHTAGSGGAFASAVLSTSEGDVIVRVPQSSSAEVQQSAELLALAALAEGARGGLPFAIPATLGMTRAGDTRAVVSTFLAGSPAAMQNVAGDSELLQGTAEAIAAIHGLPTGVVREGGLPTRSAEDVRAITERLVQRAADTGMLPATVRRRWQDVLDADAVWSFEPVPVHGSLAPESLLVDGSELRGVLGWSELSLGDPATDLGWLLDAASRVRRRVAGANGSVRVGHLDFETHNMRWRGGPGEGAGLDALVCLDDWDSLGALPEPILVGQAAGSFTSTRDRFTDPTVEQSREFLERWLATSGRSWGREEWELAWAGGLWTKVFNVQDRVVHRDLDGVLAHARPDVEERLRLAGA